MDGTPRLTKNNFRSYSISSFVYRSFTQFPKKHNRSTLGSLPTRRVASRLLACSCNQSPHRRSRLEKIQQVVTQTYWPPDRRLSACCGKIRSCLPCKIVSLLLGCIPNRARETRRDWSRYCRTSTLRGLRLRADEI